MTTQRSKDLKYYLSEIIGGLILFVILGFPLWFPMIFIVDDLITPTTIIHRMIQGESFDLDQVFSKVLHYIVMFMPGLILFIWFRTSNDSKENKIIDSDFMISKKDFTDSENVSWKPKGITGNPKNGAEWKQLKSGIYGFKSNYRYQFFTYPVAMGSALYIAISITINETSFFDAIISISGLILMVALLCNIAFYLMSHSGVWIKERNKKIQVGINLLDYSEVSFIQLLAKTQTHTNAGGEPYSVYEANIVYSGNQRHNMLNHGDLSKFTEQVRLFNSYVNTTVVASEELLNIIKQHNAEIKLI